MLTLEEFKRRVLEIVQKETGIKDPREFKEFNKKHDSDGYIEDGYYPITNPEVYNGHININTLIITTANNIIND